MKPEILRYGSAAARPKAIHLNAGPLTLFFEPDTAFLRHIRIGDHEIVRTIYAAVRDQNWGTVKFQISNFKSQMDPSSFQLAFDVECRQAEIDFVWQGTISGDTQGKVTYRFDGEARSDFLRNRIGLCVLHPITECAGKACSVEHADGSLEQGAFPRYISPDQPFKNIRAITYEVAPGTRAEVRFEGEVFEMEDQRNWTDASFKTYSTPLEIPFPARVEKGTKVQHTVIVSFVSQARKILPVVQGRGAQFSISTTPILPKPRLGLCVASHGPPLTAHELERLKALGLSHLRVDLKLAEPNWPVRLRQASAEAASMAASLYVALFLTDNAEAELDALANELGPTRPSVSLWMIFHVTEEATSERWVRMARRKLSPLGPNILFAAGSDAYFVQLNRNRPPSDSTVLPCFSINPQVHAFDNLTMVENLAAQVFAVESTQQFCKQAVVVSPVTLRPRFNPDATADEGKDGSPPRELPPPVDPRQMSLFCAGWTLGSIARLAVAGNVHSLTYHETTGWRGLMETEGGSPLPDQFHSIPGAVFPVYHVFADLMGFDRLCPTHSSHPLQTDGLTLLGDKNRRRILLANLQGEAQEIKIKTGTCQARVRYLDESNAEEAMRSPESFRATTGEMKESVSGKIELQLLPYALARVDINPG